MKDVVYLYVFDTMADWEIGYLTAEIESGRYFRKGILPLRIKTISNTTDPIVTMGGLKIIPDMKVDECNGDEAAALILPGGNTWSDQIHDPVLKLAKEYLAADTIVAAICGATVALAGVGLLDSRNHTSNALSYLKAVCPNYKGEDYYQNEPAVTDRNLITATGIAPLEFALQILRRLGVFSPEDLVSWYQLYCTRDPKHYFALIEQNK